MKFSEKKTARTQKLYDDLIRKARGDRSEEWFPREMADGFFEADPESYGLNSPLENQTVLVRRAVAIDLMLKAMTDPKYSEKTHTAEMFEGDLLLGVLPMGSNGLGKVFPQFMTKDELRAGSITNRNTGSLFGHNTMDYSELLAKGLKAKIEECDKKIAEDMKRESKLQAETGILPTVDITDQADENARKIYDNKTNKDFYRGVKIACQAVIDYARRFADIARKEAGRPDLTDGRRRELEKMAEIAGRVPEEPARNFHEAVQSITFFHIAMHASMNLMSLGRLDQVLRPYVENLSVEERPFALEIMECFLIKLAGRINLSSESLWKQDHVDYSTVLGTHAYYIDQKAGVNNFLQNIILGGKTPDGHDATNDATYLILQACENVNLSTPGVYVRLGSGSPKKLYEAVAKSLRVTRNNPAVINDDVMLPAMYNALTQGAFAKRQPESETEKAFSAKMWELANDFCVDGCWEPILNCCSDWTFTMLNLMTPLETSINQGATLSPDAELFRGAKIAPYAPMPCSFEALLETFTSQLGFFVDQCALSMFLYYMIDEYAAPSPLLSAYLKGCMERGRDKAWAGADYNLAGIIYGGFPNLVNTLLGIRKWVFPESGGGKYKLQDVSNAFKYNFTCGDPANKKLQNLYTSIQIDFDTNTKKFGDNDPEVTGLSRKLLDICFNTAMHSAEFAKKVYEDKPKKEEWKNIIALRRLTGYYGKSLRKKFDHFNMRFTVGLGTFEQYNWQGRGISASADRRSGDPLAPNFSPMPGTTDSTAPDILASFKGLGLDRFAGGVITDICLNDNGETIKEAQLEALLRHAVANGAGMFTVSIGSQELYREIYEKTIAASGMSNKEDARKLLDEYAGVNVRIGGWQTPFITLPISHMESYINRPTSIGKGE